MLFFIAVLACHSCLCCHTALAGYHGQDYLTEFGLGLCAGCVHFVLAFGCNMLITVQMPLAVGNLANRFCCDMKQTLKFSWVANPSDRCAQPYIIFEGPVLNM